MGDELSKLVGQYGLTAAILIWIVVGIAQLLQRLGPDAWNFYKKDIEDKREARQRREDAELKQTQLSLLSAQGSKTFTEEQLTMMTSETQTQLAEANEFIRKEQSDKLDSIIQQLILLKDRIDRIPVAFGEKYREEFEETRRLRASIQMIAHVLEAQFGYSHERGSSSEPTEITDRAKRRHASDGPGTSGSITHHPPSSDK